MHSKSEKQKIAEIELIFVLNNMNCIFDYLDYKYHVIKPIPIINRWCQNLLMANYDSYEIRLAALEAEDVDQYLDKIMATLQIPRLSWIERHFLEGYYLFRPVLTDPSEIVTMMGFGSALSDDGIEKRLSSGQDQDRFYAQKMEEIGLISKRLYYLEDSDFWTPPFRLFDYPELMAVLKYIRGAKLNFAQERLGFDEKTVSEEKLSTVISEIETEMQSSYQKVKNIIYETVLKAPLLNHPAICVISDN